MEREQSMGYLRDRTSVFKTFRGSSLKSQTAYRSQLSDELNPEITSNSLDLTSSIIDKANIIESRISMIEIEMQTLSEMHKRRRRIDFGNDHKAEAEIEAKTRSISNMIIEVRDIMREDLSHEMRNEQTRVIYENMQYGYTARLRKITIRFRDMQADYIKTLRKQKEKTASFMDDDVDSSVLDDLDDVAFTDSQMLQIRNNENMLRQRNEEIRHLVDMMNQLNQLFADLGTLIVEQGTMLDRIDGIVEETITIVDEGNKQIVMADHHQSNKCFYVYIIVVVVLIILFGTILVIKHQNSKRHTGGSQEQTTTNPLSMFLQ